MYNVKDGFQEKDGSSTLTLLKSVERDSLVWHRKDDKAAARDGESLKAYEVFCALGSRDGELECQTYCALFAILMPLDLRHRYRGKRKIASAFLVLEMLTTKRLLRS